MLIYKEFTFDAAHFLPNVTRDHKCRKLHGHTYHLKVYVEGPVLTDEGWVIDFGDLKTVVNPLIHKLDHAFLNEIEGLKNPTAERVAIWLWNNIKPAIPGLKRVELKETPTSGVIYEGDI